MTEPKKRGRPPKAKPEMNARVEGGSVGCAECGQAVGHYDDCPKGMGVPLSEQVLAAMDRIPRGDTPFVQMRKQETLAQLYAERVWNGQSPEVHREERLRRVKLALDGQGLSMEGVEL